MTSAAIPAAAPAKPVRERSMKRRKQLTHAALFVILAIVAFIMAAPFIWMVTSSVRSSFEIRSSDMPLWPREWHWENYLAALHRAPFGLYAFNSFLIGLVNTLTNIVLGATCGYALAKMAFKGRTAVFLSILAAQMVPFYTLVLPRFLMCKFIPLFGGNDITGYGGTGWLDSWWALLVPGAVGPFTVFLFRQFYLSTPTELQEAARIDGAGEWTIFSRIITPLVRPGLLTVALLSFEGGWNNLLWPLLVTTTESLRTIQLGLAAFRTEANTEYNLLMCGTTLASVPMIVLFVIFQKQFVNGFVSSGLK